VVVVSKTRSTIEPKIGLGNSFFESKKQNFLLQSYHRDSADKESDPSRSAQEKGFQGLQAQVSSCFGENRAL